MTKNCMFLLQIAIVRILYMADATLPSSSSSSSPSSLSLSHRVTFLNLQRHLQKVAEKKSPKRNILEQASPGDSVATNKLPHKNWAAFPASRRKKKNFSAPSFPCSLSFLRDAHKANAFFFHFKFFCFSRILFFAFQFNCPAGRQAGSESFFPALYFFTRFLVL